MSINHPKLQSTLMSLLGFFPHIPKSMRCNRQNLGKRAT